MHGQPGGMSQRELSRRFDTHALEDTQRADVSELRATFRAIAAQIVDLVPAGREQAAALTKLEECAFYAIAGVARGPADV